MLKALENIKYLDTDERTVQILTDSRIILDSLNNRDNRTHLIEQIRKKVIELENHKWTEDFKWINLLTPNVNYSGRTAPLTSKVAFYIFIQQI